MKLERIAMLVLAAVTIGIVSGGAMAMVYNGPIPTVVPPAPTLVYTIVSPGSGAPAILTPFFATAHHGTVFVQMSNQDGIQHLILLKNTGLVFNLGPHANIAMLVYLAHPGQYVWTNLIPYPGVPYGATVGILAVS